MNVRMDTHKLMWHRDVMERVVRDDRRGGNVVPITIEVSPVNFCNHSCIFCGLDGAKGHEKLDVDRLRQVQFFRKMAMRGLKGVTISGEGEPCLHPELSCLINDMVSKGLDVGLATNGSVNPEWDEILSVLTWLRFSVDAADGLTYKKVHRPPYGITLDGVLDNIRQCLEIRRQRELDVTIGMQYVIVPGYNDKGLPEFLAMIYNSNVLSSLDYITFKPYSPNPGMDTGLLPSEPPEWSQVESYLRLIEVLAEEYSGRGVRFPEVKTRRNAFEAMYRETSFEHCYALPLGGYMDAKGDFYSCIVGPREDMLAGSVYDGYLDVLLDGMERSEHIRWARNGLDCQTECRKNCRFARHNEFLTEIIENPPGHINFI